MGPGGVTVVTSVVGVVVVGVVTTSVVVSRSSSQFAPFESIPLSQRSRGMQKAPATVQKFVSGLNHCLLAHSPRTPISSRHTKNAPQRCGWRRKELWMAPIHTQPSIGPGGVVVCSSVVVGIVTVVVSRSSSQNRPFSSTPLSQRSRGVQKPPGVVQYLNKGWNQNRRPQSPGRPIPLRHKKNEPHRLGSAQKVLWSRPMQIQFSIGPSGVIGASVVVMPWGSQFTRCGYRHICLS